MQCIVSAIFERICEKKMKALRTLENKDKLTVLLLQMMLYGSVEIELSCTLILIPVDGPISPGLHHHSSDELVMFSSQAENLTLFYKSILTYGKTSCFLPHSIIFQ